MSFTEPTKDDYKRLAQRWVSIRRLVKEHFGYELSQSTEDLDYIQKVIDHELTDFNDDYANECLGLVFGRILASNVDGMDWWAVDDEFGRDIVIRYRDSSIQINALDMIGKRLRENIKPDVVNLYQAVLKEIEEVKGLAK